MTATEDRIDKLFGQILIESIPRDEIAPEKAYASPNKPEKFGGPEKVRTFLLHDLTAARR